MASHGCIVCPNCGGGCPMCGQCGCTLFQNPPADLGNAIATLAKYASTLPKSPVLAPGKLVMQGDYLVRDDDGYKSRVLFKNNFFQSDPLTTALRTVGDQAVLDKVDAERKIIQNKRTNPDKARPKIKSSMNIKTSKKK